MTQTPPFQRPILLLVDDEAAFADALSFRLESRGLPCLCAYRGEAALELAHLPELEVVLLDVNMPGLDGLATLERIKAKRPDVEVLLLTGESDFSIAAKGMRRGASDYLLKPVDFSSLLASIAKARTRVAGYKERMRAAEAGKLIALGALAAGVGHEINNPLQIIVQAAEWMEELLEDCPGQHCDVAALRATAKKIAAQGKRCGGITAQLLDLAQRSRASKATTSLPRLLEKVLNRMQERAQHLGVRLDVRMSPSLPVLPCSPAELEPVLAHLVTNALDAIERKTAEGSSAAPPLNGAAAPAREGTPESGGEGGEHPKKQSSPGIWINAEHSEGAVHLEISDSGAGIAPEILPHIYEPFFSTRPVGKGTGMGLTVCHSIITALRGRIRHLTRPSGGTTCRVEIPLPEKF